MAYNDTPLPTDLVSDSQPDIRENFQLLEGSQVVDEGSTADGDYIRYENGWQLIFYDDFDMGEIPSATAGTWNFPVDFSSNNYYQDIILNHDNFDGADRDEYISNLGWVFRNKKTNETEFLVACDVNLETISVTNNSVFAIGRWK